MKKIGIVTLVGNFNHGNRLQNFALQESIKKLGYDVDTIKVNDSEKKLKKLLKIIIYYVSFLKKNNIKINEIKRMIKIENFTNKYIEQSIYSIPINHSSHIDNDYSMFVVGSDQVWNPNYRLDENYFLNFTERRKISYAASFGISDLPSDFKNNLIKKLNYFYSISVREKSAVDLLQTEVKQKIVHVLDPTFLISKEEWEHYISKKNNQINKKFIVLYFLGEIDDAVQKEINCLADKEKYSIINLMDKRIQQSYAIDPLEFLQYIKESSLVFTDSFHGTVFSVIFNKPFVVCERTLNTDGNMNTRLDSILEILGLSDRTFNRQIVKKEWLQCSFKYSNDKLDQLKKESFDFLRKSLED